MYRELEDGADKNDKDDLNEKGHVSNTSTLFSIICVVAGTGILAIAHALSRSGWIGLLFLFTSAVMSHYTGVLLIRCLYAIPGKRLTGYADIGYAAFGKPGSIIGFLFSQLMLFLTPTIYIMMASENLSQILMDYELVWFHRRTCVWMLCILVGIPFFCVRHMKDVSYLRQPTQTTCVWMLCILVGIPFFCVRHMKDVSYLRQPTQTKLCCFNGHCLFYTDRLCYK
ncbi:hypothetical protein RMCBS344292_15296 [Rhizopus microsporus]|nr:hypothetical protein RMCBS344292_15296 [Rhizopus microsporus]